MAEQYLIRNNTFLLIFILRQAFVDWNITMITHIYLVNENTFLNEITWMPSKRSLSGTYWRKNIT